MEKEEGGINCLGNRSVLAKLSEQKFLKALSALGSEAVNGPLSAASDPLTRFGCDIARLGQLAHGIVKRADIDMGVALNQGVMKSPLDFVGVQVATVESAKDKKFRFHIRIVIL
jgi:hypothetical protein